MSEAGSERLLLDTNVVIHLIRDDVVGRAIQSRFALASRTEVPLISAVALGEAESFALSNDWGEAKRRRLQELFHELVVVSIESGSVIDAYAELDVSLREAGKPIGENDTWIAASAVATRAALVSTDRDHLNVPSGMIRLHLVDAKTGDVREPGGLA